MDDQGFDFRTAPERRERKPFEPPPWEREAFEQLQRERERATGPEAAPAREPVEPKRAEREAQEDGEGPRDEEAGQGAGPTLTEAQVLELLARLAAEEPDAHAPATQVTVGASIVLLPIGVMMVFWGMAALARAASAQAGAGIARTGAVTLLVFGAGFVAAAFWLIYRLMKQRGVL